MVAIPISNHRSQENVCNTFSRCFSARLENGDHSASVSELQIPNSLSSDMLRITLCPPYLYKPVYLISVGFVHIVQNPFCRCIPLLKDSGISIFQSVYLKNVPQLCLNQILVHLPDDINCFDLEIKIGKVGGRGRAPVVPHLCSKIL